MTSDAHRTLPKAELHVHIEGTVSPELAQRLAARHGMDVGHLIHPERGYVWRDFGEFLAAYDGIADAVRTAEDYYDVAYEYLAASAAGGVIYTEMFMSSDHAEECGLPYPDLVASLVQAAEDARARHGIHARYILTCVRHLGVAAAEKAARNLERHPHPMVVGFGMAGDEAVGAYGDFASAFAIARGAGAALTAHAGEILGPESVRDALDALDVARIGHGVRSFEDPALLDELVARQIPLEICPSSNVELSLFPSLAAHPVKRYLEAGAKVTLNSDDPPFFHTDIAAEYDRVAAVHELTPAELVQITENAIDAAFCDADLKARLRARVADWQRSAGE
ncbi:MAG: adenosine deaminase [Sphingomonadales bacterium]|nr:adenosine deaminase [Sphingomonadales bacterium]